MTSLLTLLYLSCVSSSNMLSMLLLLVGTYVMAGLWLISNHLTYIGLLYILVYVGAIVVLIIFVVQLTNTSLVTNYSISPTSTVLTR
jgi:NADH:ubiquinone oxidoreductase subunit 6 (subunit J)